MWQPWIGSGYEARRLLILGESCYAWEEDGQVKEPQPDHPVVMARYAMAAFPRGQRFLDMISRGVCGKYAPSLAEMTAAWESIAFTNYVPASVGIGPRERPSPEAWQQADDEWQLVLARLKPRNIIVLGRGMWGYMPETQVLISKDVQGYRLPDGTVAMCRATWHPAGGQSWISLAAEIVAAEQPRED